MQKFDSVIIGGGQNGLVAAKNLQELGLSYHVLERHRVGEVWKNRLEGMKLFTSRQFCSLPGLDFPGDPNGFPSVTEMADYLAAYVRANKLIVDENTEVIRVTKSEKGFDILRADGECVFAKTVINATGSNQVPRIPVISENLSNDVLQLNGGLKNLNQIENNSRVAVVGDAATGRQIAGGLSKRCKVILATGTSRGLPPNRVLGKDLFWWMSKSGILFADKNSLVAKILKKRNPVPCAEFNNRQLAKLNVKVEGRAVACFGNSIEFEGGRSHEVDVVVLATGYRDNTGWLELPHCIADEEFVQEYGETPEPGLFVIGRKWMSCRASELVMGVEHDAHSVIRKLQLFLSC